jgi:hypothetical protein
MIFLPFYQHEKDAYVAIIKKIGNSSATKPALARAP